MLLAQWAPKVLLALLILAMAVAGVKGFLAVPARHRQISRWSVIRYLRRMRKALQSQPAAMAWYSASFALICVAALLLVATESPNSLYLLAPLIGIPLCIGTLLDWYGRLSFVLSSALARKLAKASAGFLAAVVAFASTVLAKQLAHGISHVDPAAMPEFVRLCATLVFPYAFAAVATVSLSALMFAQYIVMTTLLIGTWAVRSATMAVPVDSYRRLAFLTYRVAYGRKPPAKRDWWYPFVAGVQHLMRPFGTAIVVVGVATMSTGLLALFDMVPNRLLQQALVAVEYRAHHLCENVPSQTPIAYLSGGYVSVARRVADGYEFEVAKCHKDTRTASVRRAFSET